jgi:hypothetical protein
MHRRKFLTASLAASAVSLTRKASAQTTGTATSSTREYYQLRRYFLANGAQTKLTETYFNDALIPALTRLGMGPVGAFKLDYGPETPTYYLLMPAPSVDTLVTVDLKLAQDDDFLKKAEPFWSAPASAPAYVRVDSQLMAAFEGWPKLTPPPGAATKAKRIFQLRTYESPSDRDHVSKVEMFHKGEFEYFKNAGFHPVFFGDTLVGPRMPNLTYMLCLDKLEDLNKEWSAFGNDPGWKKLSAADRYAFEPIVSNISNLLLSPLASSQV